MEIIIAKNSGFCFGVKRALEKTLESAESPKQPIHTLGPLIHNHQVLEFLESRGIYGIDSIEDKQDGLLIIRSHGVPLEIYRRAEEKHIKLVDATCPYVRKVQEIARAEHEEGRKVVIIGNPNHPEVIGINGWCKNEAIIINRESDIDSISIYDKISVVAQTTLNTERWNLLTQKIISLGSDARLFDTICAATKKRQKSCIELAVKADVMLIFGGFDSSNTQKLFELSKMHCDESHHIETADQIDWKWLEGAEIVGITSGASTPDWIIKDAIKKIKIKVGS